MACSLWSSVSHGGVTWLARNHPAGSMRLMTFVRLLTRCSQCRSQSAFQKSEGEYPFPLRLCAAQCLTRKTSERLRQCLPTTLQSATRPGTYIFYHHLFVLTGFIQRGSRRAYHAWSPCSPTKPQTEDYIVVDMFVYVHA